MDNFSDLTMAFVSAVAVLLLSLCAFRFYRGKNKKNLPPIAGTVFHQFINFRRLHDYHTELSHSYGTYRLLAPFRNHIYVTHPADVEHVLRTNFKNYGKGQFADEMLGDLLGGGIFVVDSEKWHQQRRLGSYQFSSKVSRNFSSGIFKTNAAKLAIMISIKASTKDTFDIQDLFMKSTLDSSLEARFGTELNILQGSVEGSRISYAFKNSIELIVRRLVDPFWKIENFLGIGHEGKLLRHIKTLDELIYKLIEARMKNLSSGSNSSVNKHDLLSKSLAEMERHQENINQKYLRDIIPSFLFARRDTVAATMSWFVYMICKHATIQEKVAKEVKETVGINGDMNIEEFIAHLTDEALNKMRYLRAALTETLKLYPTLPSIGKMCFSDDTLPGGFDVAKGDFVFYQPYAMGRMKYLWGEDAETFRPERWLNVDGLFQNESPFKFTAFQAGPRICLGKDFAYKLMKTYAAVLLHFFKFKLPKDNEALNYRTTFFMPIDKGLYVHVFLR